MSKSITLKNRREQPLYARLGCPVNLSTYYIGPQPNGRCNSKPPPSHPLLGLVATSQSDPLGLIPASIASNDLVPLTRKPSSPLTEETQRRLLISIKKNILNKPV